MNQPSDFDRDLERIDQEIEELKRDGPQIWLASEKATRFVYRLYQRASLAGDFAELEVAETALKAALELFGSAPDLYFVKASLDFKFHRLGAVRNDLEIAPPLRNSSQGRALMADLDFQEGRYDEARKGYECLIEEDRTWDNLQRLAYLESKLGDVTAADQLLSEAEDELTAKEMRSYAWLELQRGVLDLRRGCYEDALDHYNRASRAYSGYWLVDDHMAELLGAQRRFAEAIELYEQVVARVPRPELQQALGELYLLDGKPEEAELWNEKALFGYLKSAERGDVHYYHHLTDFYADVREDGAEAVKWAQKDIELRDNFSTQAALAWSLYRAGDYAQALARINQALSSGVNDAHMFYQAGMIHQAVNGNGYGERYLKLAADINPHYQSFHVHR